MPTGNANLTFVGRRTPGLEEAVVTVTSPAGEVTLEEWLEGCHGERLVISSPAGFEWGYGGAGPYDLAANMILAATGSERLARALAGRFRDEVVSRYDRRGFRAGALDVLRWVEGAVRAGFATPARRVKLSVAR